MSEPARRAGRAWLLPALAPTLLLLFLARLAVVLWGIDRGFDLGDGSFFVLNLNRPEEAPPLFEFYRLLTLLDPRPRFGIVEARLLRLLTELLATFVLALGVARFARRQLPEAGGVLLLLGFAGLGALLSVGARSFGYNDATNLLLYASTACLFLLLSAPVGPAGARGRLAWSGLAGLGIGLQLFVKFPSALLLLAGAVLVVALAVQVRGAERIALLGSLATGAVAAVLVFVALNDGVDPLLAKWRYAGEVSRATGYDLRRILAVYLHHDLGSHVNLLGLAATFGLTLAGALRLLSGAGRLDRALCLALVLGTALLALGTWSHHPDNVHPLLELLFCLTLFVAGVWWWLVWRDAGSGGRARRLLPLLLLPALPFVAMAGTNVALTLRLPSHLAPVFLLLGVLHGPLRAAGYRRFAGLGTLLLVGATGASFWLHHVERPYGVAAPLPAQVHETPGLPGLRVDLETKRFLEELSRRMAEAGFEPGDPVVALDYMPGLVLYLGGRSPGFPFFVFERPAFNCWALSRAGGDERPFLILGQLMSRPQAACIETFSYPDDFRHAGTLRNPWAEAIAWFSGGPDMPFVHLFAPREETAGRTPDAAEAPTR